MTNSGQIVAALAGGALWAIAAMLTFRQCEARRRAEQQRRIDSATRLVLDGVTEYRQQVRDRPPEQDGHRTSGAVAEVHAKAHLHLVSRQPGARKPDRLAPRASQVDKSAAVRGW